MTASWKTASYYKRFGFVHYGTDMVAQDGVRTLYASGNGKVVAAGYDSVVGNVVAVVYQDVLHRPSGRSMDVVLRYFHLEQIKVKVGQKVTKDTVLGLYGNTGMLAMAKHLHMEADADIKHPLYSPTLRTGTLLHGTSKGANDKTMYNPLAFLHCKTDAPDFQCYTTANDAYIRPEDKITGDWQA